MIEGDVEVIEIDALPRERGDRARRIQVWREVNELPDRELMRDGRWLV
jgi:hypothetical protein